MKEDKSLQVFLIRYFTVILIVVSGLEGLILMGLERFIIPILRDYFMIDLKDTRFVGVGVFFLVFLLLAELLYVLLVILLPNQILYSIQWLLQQLNRFHFLDRAGGSFPKDMTLNELLSREKLILLSLLLAAVLAAVVAPFAIGAYIYARIVIREFRKIESAREKEREEYNRRRNLMLSDIAHDLRTPITTISGYAQALNEDLIKEKDRQKEYLSAIQNKSLRLTELIGLLFDYVRLDSEGYTMKRASVDLSELLRSSVALMFTDFEENGMELEAAIPEEVCTVEGDGVQLSRVFHNLLTNVLRHNDPGTKVFVEMQRTAEMAIIRIADSGNPIPTGLEQHLFEPFAMGDGSRSSSGGSGLGLSIARKIVAMHGGDLAYHRDYHGYRKVFVIQIPLKHSTNSKNFH